MADRHLGRETRLLQALEFGGIGAWEWDHIAHQGEVSARYRQLHGFPDADGPFTREMLFSVMRPADQEPFMTIVNRALASSELMEVEYRVRLADGTERWLRGAGHAMGGDPGNPATRSSGIVEDITGRKQIEQRLQEREQHLELALEASRAGTFEWDIAADRITRPVDYLEILAADGKPPANLEQLIAMVHPADRNELRRNVASAMRNRARPYRSRHRYMRQGKPPW